MRLKVLPYRADGWSGADMTFVADRGIQPPDILKGKCDYARTVLLTGLIADHLPQLPDMLRNLQCALEDSSTVLDKVCNALESHPHIRANFIRIASMAEPVQPISIPMDHLVVLLGKQRVWTTAVAAFLLHELNSRWSTTAQRELASIGIANANTALAYARSTDEPEQEQAYVSGILSIIGLLPLLDLSGATDQAPAWLDITAEAMEKQQETFGTDFRELDRWVRLLWRLPLEHLESAMTSVPAEGVTNALALPKEFYSPVVPPADAVSRNLVLVPRGIV